MKRAKAKSNNININLINELNRSVLMDIIQKIII